MKVYNARLIKLFNAESTVYVGRKHPRFPQGSVLANPFPITATRDREQSLQLYRMWLWNKIKKKEQAVLAELYRIGELELSVICWCAPLGCHGEEIIRAAKWLVGDRNAAD